jgi:hypothetical protein
MAASAFASRARRWLKSAREFLYGMAGHEFERHAVELRAELDDLFVLITVGDLVGVPIMPPYYSLRLMPYMRPRLDAWKRRVLRERHLLDTPDYDLHQI